MAAAAKKKKGGGKGPDWHISCGQRADVSLINQKTNCGASNRGSRSLAKWR